MVRRCPDRRRSGTVERVIAEDDVAGIDTGERHGLARRARRCDGRRSASTSSPAVTPTSPTSCTAADGRRLVLRRPPLGHVLASAHDMGREHRIIAGLQGSGGAGAAGARAVRRRGGQRRAVLRDGLRRRRRGARPRRSAERVADARGAGQRQPLARRHDGGDPRRRPRGGRAGRPRPPRGLHRAPAEALVRAVEPAEDPRAARSSTRSTTRSPAWCRRAGPGDDRPRRLPPRQHDRVAGRRRAGRARLGDLHARRPARRHRAAAGVLDRPGRRARARGRGQSTTAPGFWNRAQLAERYAEVSGRDLSNLDFYVAFGFWKLACILEGVYARYLGGALGDRDPAELAPFKAQVDGAARDGRRRRWSGMTVTAMTDHRFVAEPPELDEPVLVVMMTGWIDASGAAAAAMSTLEKETAAQPARRVRRRHLHRLPGPPADARAARRRQHAARVVGAGAAGRSRPNGRDVLLLSGPEPDMAWHRFADDRRRPRRAARRVARWPPSAPTRSPRRTPGRRTCRRRRRRPR